MNSIIEQLNDQDRAALSARFVPFHSDAIGGLEYGADALLFVMAYGHTISVPDHALMFAEKVAIVSIARRDTPEPVLRDVNRAIDIIAASLRDRTKIDAEASPAVDANTIEPHKQDLGPMAKLSPAPIVRPPAPTKIDIQF